MGNNKWNNKTLFYAMRYVWWNFLIRYTNGMQPGPHPCLSEPLIQCDSLDFLLLTNLTCHSDLLFYFPVILFYSPVIVIESLSILN